LLVLTGALAAGFFATGFAFVTATGFATVLATGLAEVLPVALTEVLPAGLAIFLTNAFGFAVFFVAIFVFLLRHCFNTHDTYRSNHC
jgi:hypothetical protein